MKHNNKISANCLVLGCLVCTVLLARVALSDEIQPSRATEYSSVNKTARHILEAGTGSNSSTFLPTKPPGSDGHSPNPPPLGVEPSTIPENATCQPYEDIVAPGAETSCGARVYNTEPQCISVPGCTWTASGSCRGVFNPDACAELDKSACTVSVFCTDRESFVPPPPPPPETSSGTSPRSSPEDDDYSLPDNGVQPGLGSVARDSVDRGGSAVEGTGETASTAQTPSSIPPPTRAYLNPSRAIVSTATGQLLALAIITMFL